VVASRPTTTLRLALLRLARCNSGKQSILHFLPRRTGVGVLDERRLSPRDLGAMGRPHRQIVLPLQGDAIPKINGELSTLGWREMAEAEERVRHALKMSAER
jgi:hypothetical protein